MRIYFDGHDWKLMDPTFASSESRARRSCSIGNGGNYKAKIQLLKAVTNYRGNAMADLEKKMRRPDSGAPIPCSQLSAFCLQISLLLEAAVPLDEGFSIMAEDAEDENEKKMLLYMAEGAELGDPCFKVLEDTGVFPAYVVRMAKLGQETGTLDQMMKSLSDYYEKEDRLIKTVKKCCNLSGYDDPYASCGLICPVCKGNAYFFKGL